MGKITIDQSHQVIATLMVNIDWKSIDFKNSGLQDFIARDPKRVGRQFTAFLKNGGLFFKRPNIIKIDRSVPFDPAIFLSKRTSVKEQDKRALAIAEVDLNNVRLETMLTPGETSVNGEEKLKRLEKAGYIGLDAKVFQTLWENQSLIPEEWKEKTDGKTTFILFNGTVLEHYGGDDFIMGLYWSGDNWCWFIKYLKNGCFDCDLSVVLSD